MGTKTSPVYRATLRVVIMFPLYFTEEEAQGWGQGPQAGLGSDPGPITSQLVTSGSDSTSLGLCCLLCKMGS